MSPARSVYLNASATVLCMVMASTCSYAEAAASEEHRTASLLVSSRVLAQVATTAAVPAHKKTFVPLEDGRKAFALGFLEFDWDPRVPSGLPGFDLWPTEQNLPGAP